MLSKLRPTLRNNKQTVWGTFCLRAKKIWSNAHQPWWSWVLTHWESERSISPFGILDRVAKFCFTSSCHVSQYKITQNVINYQGVSNEGKGNEKTLQPLAPPACCYKLIYGCTCTFFLQMHMYRSNQSYLSSELEIFTLKGVFVLSLGIFGNVHIHVALFCAQIQHSDTLFPFILTSKQGLKMKIYTQFWQRLFLYL